MLKKLVKYGNSNALVLDKAILELLNIREGSIIKISTDGKSLILTPHEPAPVEQVSSTVIPDDVFFDAALANWKKTNPQWEGGVKEFKELGYTTQVKLAEHADELKTLDTNEKFQAALVQLKKQGTDTSSSDFIEKLNALRYEHAPRLETIEKELKNQYLINPNSSAYQEMVDAFTAVHKKYMKPALMRATMELPTNEEYQHERALLAEQYALPEQAQEFLQADTELRCKYIPEWRAYQDEVKKVTQEYEKKIGWVTPKKED